MEIFIIELGLYIPTMGFLKCPRSSWASKLDAHPLVFFCWAFIALVHLLHGNPYSSCWHQLMGISIARWLAALMWDFLLFCLLHITPTIIFYSTYSDISMACAHVLREGWKGWSALKSMNQMLHFCHTKMFPTSIPSMTSQAIVSYLNNLKLFQPSRNTWVWAMDIALWVE